jgi:hypothetical protein
MEILVEILLWFLQIFGELILQLAFELIAEIGLQGLREPFRRPKPLHPWFAAVCYLAFGALAGWVSLWFFPSPFIQSHAGRLANLALTPLAAGGVMAAVGAWRLRRGKELIRLDRFVYGYLFALAMAVIRFDYPAWQG